MTVEKTATLGPRDLIVALLINLTWGLNIIAVKMAVMATAPFAAGGLRQAVVLIACLPFLRWVPGRMRPLLVLAALNGTIFLIFTNFSLQVADNVSALAIAGQLGVPFSLILGVIFLGERIALPRMLGIALAFGGVVLLVFDPGIFSELPGLILMALGTFTWAVGAFLQRKLADVPALTIYAWIGLGGVIGLMPLSMWLEPGAFRNLPNLPLRDVGWLLFSGLGSSVIGQGGMAWLLQRHPISTVLPLTLGAPVIAVSASSYFFGTVLTPVMIAGGLLTLSGVVIITLRSARAKKGQP
ncbi:O-acetylserine/cysteine efflux transporter [Sphingomonas laterariae]|uniref:O-acetylserine/cysteine efflux transporter n=1 Tax=Edaphosphingomonas laterariae TaxID=861865 RepID=A0A239E6B1_9SPHN|nr:DMT family transporter [Sphingomonas laterariae]SNS39563.1 O-acetylserine/cysteine efflux transporter [Sphingomonas laterariae]